MRIAVLIIGLLLGLVLLVQTLLVYAGGSLGSNRTLAGAGAIGLLVAVMWLIGSAFVIGVPILSTIVFVVAGILAFAFSGSGYSDLAVWGGASLVLALLSFIEFLTKRRGVRVEERKQRERDARLAAGIRESMTTASLHTIAAPSVKCERCGSSLPSASKFCQECGAPRSYDERSALPSTSHGSR